MTIYKINDNGITRDMTEQETTEYIKTVEAAIKDQETIDKDKQTRAKAKADVLQKLGLSATEAEALFA